MTGASAASAAGEPRQSAEPKQPAGSGASHAREAIADWFLSKDERGNPATRLDDRHPGQTAWASGNRARPLVHGSEYYTELVARIAAMGEGDVLFFTDWRGDPDERLTGEPGSEVSAVLEAAARRGVDVRGLIWRSHWDRFGYSGDEARHLGEEIEEAGGECLRDMRCTSGGSHHQKFVVLRHARDPRRDVAYVGGIDLCHSRRDTDAHDGDPQPIRMSKSYGPHPAWHDVQVALEGPVVFDVETVFRERWQDSNPLTRHPVRRLESWLDKEDQRPDPLSPQQPPPPVVEGGTHHVQLLRTYPDLDHGYDFAPDGEYSVARGYEKALRRARRFIYVEDQYLWSSEVAATFIEALRANPELHVVGVMPHVPNQEGPLASPPNMIGRERAVSAIREAGGERVAFYGIENDADLPIYVHAKVCVIDDRWATIGSDNFNRRSWTNDSELSAVVWDDEPSPSAGPGSSRYAVDLRTRLAREHLGLDPRGDDHPELRDAHTLFAALREAADLRQAWHDGPRTGVRPRGRVRDIVVPEVKAWQRPWATAAYERVFDPDGRREAMKRAGRF